MIKKLDAYATKLAKVFSGSEYKNPTSFLKLLLAVIVAFGVLIFFLNTVDFNKLKSQTSFFQDNPPPPPPELYSPPQPPEDILSEGNVQGEQISPTTSSVCILYDFDGDGKVTQADVQLVIAMYGKAVGDSNYNDSYDLNKDGVIDASDVSMVTAQVGRDCAGSTQTPLTPPPTATSSATPTPTPKPVLIPEAPPDIACNGAWQDIKDLGSYAHNAMVSYNGRLILTTVEPNNEAYRYGQKVIAREINPRTNRDTGWYEVGFKNSQNSHVLIEQNGQLTLYVYGNVAPGSNNNRTVFKGVYLGERRWGNWVNTGALNLGRTGPYTAIFDGQLYRFWANYGPKAVLQRCSEPPPPDLICSGPLKIIALTTDNIVVLSLIGTQTNCQNTLVWVSIYTTDSILVNRTSCQISGLRCATSQPAPPPGDYKVVAVADLDRDGKWYESGEYDVKALRI